MSPLSILRLVGFRSGLLLFGIVSPAEAQLAAGQHSAERASDPADIDLSQLPVEERAELLARLSDEEVRNLFVQYLEQSALSAAAVQPLGALEQIDETMGAARDTLTALLQRAGELFEVPSFLVSGTSRGLGDGHFYLVVAVFAGLALAGYGVERLYRRGVAQS